MIWTDLAFGPCYMGLNLEVIGLQFNFFFFGNGPQFGPRIGPEFGMDKQGPTGWA